MLMVKSEMKGGGAMNLDHMRQRLIAARNAAGYNRKQFAAELGIPYRTITNYENGSREPGSDYISKVADFCGCTTDWLLGLTDSPGEVGNEAGGPLEPQLELLMRVCEPLNATAIGRLIAYAEDMAFNPANKK